MRSFRLFVPAVLALLAGGDPVRAQQPTPLPDVYQAADEEPVKVFVHTWALRLRVGRPVTTAPEYEVVHVSEGPFEGARAEARARAIMTSGLDIGIHYFPLHRVQLVELRDR